MNKNCACIVQCSHFALIFVGQTLLDHRISMRARVRLFPVVALLQALRLCASSLYAILAVAKNRLD